MKQEVARALEWINEYRSTQGADPLSDLPKGIPRQALHCIIARALPKDAGDRGWMVSPTIMGDWLAENRDTRDDIALPDFVGAVARMFDDGKLPEYEEAR